MEELLSLDQNKMEVINGHLNGVIQDPQYSKTAVLNNPHVRDICNFYSVSYNYHKGSTSFLKDNLDNLDESLFQELQIIFTTIHILRSYKNNHNAKLESLMRIRNILVAQIFYGNFKE